MSNNDIEKLQPIPNRAAWRKWLNELNSDSRSFSEQYIRPGSLAAKVGQVTFVESVRDEIFASEIMQNMQKQITR